MLGKVNSKRVIILKGRIKFKVEDLVRITKENVVYQGVWTFSTKIFRVVKGIQRLLKRLTNSMIYRIVLSKVSFTITRLSRLLQQTEFQIDKMVRTSKTVLTILSGGEDTRQSTRVNAWYQENNGTFYVTLPSGSSGYFPFNTIVTFRTKLATPLELKPHGKPV